MTYCGMTGKSRSFSLTFGVAYTVVYSMYRCIFLLHAWNILDMKFDCGYSVLTKLVNVF